MHAFPWHTAEFTLMRSFQFSLDSMVWRSDDPFDTALLAYYRRGGIEAAMRSPREDIRAYPDGSAARTSLAGRTSG
jgi:hypothetical protein